MSRLAAFGAAVAIAAVVAGSAGARPWVDEPRHARPAGIAFGAGHGESGLTLEQMGSPLMNARRQIADPAMGFAAWQQGQQQAASIAAAPAAGGFGGAWREIGPKPYHHDDPTYGAATGSLANGWNVGSGRVTAIAVDQTDASGNTVWIGTGSGGVWVTRNGGAKWTSVFDKQPTLAIGAVAIDPANHNRVFVGTGEANFTTRSYNFAGTGVYRTTDGGKSWTRAVRNVRANVIGHIEIAAGKVFVASDRGLWRSVDGGTSYQNVMLPTDGGRPATGVFGNVVTDVRAKPDDAKEITAAVGWMYGKEGGPGNGLYRSLKAGAPGSWEQMNTSGLTTGSRTGDPIGRISLSYSPSDSNVLWAVVQDAGANLGVMRHEPDPIGDVPYVGLGTALNGVYRSGDDAASWVLKATPETLAASPGSALTPGAAFYAPGAQSSYNTYITVSPLDPNVVVLGLEEIYETTGNANNYGLATWTTIGRYSNQCTVVSATDCSAAPSPSPWAGNTTHPDQHAGAFAAGGHRYYAGNDGGIYTQSTDNGPLNNQGWSDRNSTLGTVQPFSAMMSGDGTVYAGLQDNDTAKILPSGLAVSTLQGDGAELVVSPTNSDLVMAEQTFGGIWKSSDGGLNWSFIQPAVTNPLVNQQLEIDPRDEHHITLGASAVVETTKGVDTNCGTAADKAIGPFIGGPIGVGPPVDQCDWMISFDLGTDNPAATQNATSALDTDGAVVYDGYCGICHLAAENPDESAALFHSGIATNRRPGCTPVTGKDACWHFATGRGLPNRLITDIAIDPRNPSTIYTTVGGFSQRWTPPGQNVPRAGHGHVFVSRDAGESFTDISRNMPDLPADAVEVLGDRLFVGTESGVYTTTRPGTPWQRLGTGLPNAPAVDLTFNPQKTKLVVATYGRGVWIYPLPGGKTKLAPAFKTTQPKPSSALRGNRSLIVPAERAGSASSSPAGGFPISATTLGVVAAAIVARRRVLRRT